MANASTVRRQIGGTQQLTIASLPYATYTGTATAFQLNNNGLTLTGGGVIPLSAGVTGLYAGTGQVLHVAATGVVTGATATTSTLILSLYQVPAAKLPIADTLAGAQTFGTGWNVIKTSTTRTLATAQSSWSIDARLQLDAQGNLDGQATDTINSQTDVYAAITAITGLVGEADLNFVVVATLATAGTVFMDEFRLDLE